MKHLKNFFESIDEKDLEILKETYLNLCDILDSVIDNGVIVRMQTQGVTWGLLQRKNVEHFIEFCKSLKKTVYYLQFEFNLSDSINKYRSKNGGKFPDWFISDLEHVINYLKYEEWNTKLEVLTPNPNYEIGTTLGFRKNRFKTNFANVDEINIWFKNTVCIYILFGKGKNLEKGIDINL
jgi:hypothetical protein